jgi:hypothetical protein
MTQTSAKVSSAPGILFSAKFFTCTPLFALKNDYADEASVAVINDGTMQYFYS